MRRVSWISSALLLLCFIALTFGSKAAFAATSSDQFYW